MFVGSLYIRFLLFVVRIRDYRGLRAEVDFCHFMGLYVLGIYIHSWSDCWQFDCGVDQSTKYRAFPADVYEYFAA